MRAYKFKTIYNIELWKYSLKAYFGNDDVIKYLNCELKSKHLFLHSSGLPFLTSLPIGSIISPADSNLTQPLLKCLIKYKTLCVELFKIEKLT